MSSKGAARGRAAGTRLVRGLGPLFGGPEDQHLRVSDAERQQAADRLAAHYADGRLDQLELDERTGEALRAKTRGELRALFADLPEPGLTGMVPDRPGGVPVPGGSGAVARTRCAGPVRQVAIAAVLVVFAMVAAHMAAVIVPGIGVAILVVAALALAGRLARPRRHP